MTGPPSVSIESDTRATQGLTRAYVLGGEHGLLIDPAARHHDLDRLVAETNAAHVAVTHLHSDHVGGVQAYAEREDLTVWARAGRTSEFTTATGVEPDHTFHTGTTLPIGSGIDIVDTPGHAPEHVAFASGSRLVSGDLALDRGSVVIGNRGDMRAYVTSLRRVIVRDPASLHPGHGPNITDPRETCIRLLTHRMARERRVHDAVTDGALTPEEILDRAYDKPLEGVRDLAKSTVVSHLEKLAHEGALQWDGVRARPT